jgi:hypothetical protein
VIEHYSTMWLAGEAVDVAETLAAINCQRRLLEGLGLQRRARDVTTLSDYLDKKHDAKTEATDAEVIP